MRKFFQIISVLVLMVATLTSNIYAEDAGQDMRIKYPGIQLLSNGRLLDSEGNEYVDGDIKGDAKFTLSYEWAISNDISESVIPGDYYEFQLPESLKVNGSTEGTLGSYGTYSVSPLGIVRLTFNQTIREAFDNHGSFYLGLELNPDYVSEPGPVLITVPVTEDVKYEFDVKPTQEVSAIEKEGNPNKLKNPEFITWNITINKNYDELSNAVVEDFIPNGLTLRDVKIYDVTTDLHGNVTQQDELSSVVYTEVDGVIRFNEPIARPYRIEVITDIDVHAPVGEKLSYINRARLSSDSSEDIETTATVVIESGHALTKKGIEYKPEEKTMKWRITINGDSKTLTNPWITDTLDTRLSLDKETVIVKGIQSGNIYDNYEVSESLGGFDIIFSGTISEELVIEYITSIKDDVVIVGGESFSNTVVFGEYSLTVGQGVGQPLFWKDHVGLNYETQTATWRYEINRAHEVMKNATIDDVFESGNLQYVDNSFKLWDVTTSIEWVAGVDYEVQETSTGLRIVLLKETNTRLRAEYQTTYHLDNTLPRSTLLRNTATLKYLSRDNREITISDYEEMNVNSDTAKNGFKNGTYNAVSKEIEWTVALNYDRIHFNNATFRDTIGLGQTFVDNSLVIYPYTITENGSIVVDTDNPFDIADFSVVLPTADNGNTVMVDFSTLDTGKTYLIKFRTSLANAIIVDSYENTALYTVDATEYALDASVDVKYGNEVLSKDGKQNGDAFEWMLMINRSQSYLENVVVQDTPSSNQIFDLESFSVFETVVSENGDVSVNYDSKLKINEDYSIDIVTSEVGESFSLKFANPISQSYVIQYRTFGVFENNNYVISNGATLTADGIEETDVDNSDSKQFVATRSGGDGTSRAGIYTLRKVDSEGNPLEGVVFTLTFADNAEIQYVLITDENGTARFNKLRFGEYTLVETTPLPGYKVDTDLARGISITINADTNPNDVQEIENSILNVTLAKRNSHKELLDGAVFSLEKEIDGVYEPILHDLVSTQGVVIVSGIVSGKYRFVEMLANDAYLLNLEPVYFEVTGTETEDIELDFINYQGSITIRKLDEKNKLLQGAIFSVYDAQGHVIYDKLEVVTGEITISDLAPGEYTIVENTPPHGYERDIRDHRVVIEAEYSGEYVAKIVDVVNYLLPEAPNDTDEELGNLGTASTLKTVALFTTGVGLSLMLMSKRRKQEDTDI